MKYLLNVIYVLLLIAISPWLVWSAIRKGKYREGWAAKLLGHVPVLPPAKVPRIWFHAVSVGEVNLLKPILDELLAAAPEIEIVITTTTKTGFHLAKQKYTEHTVSYGPLDFSWAVQNVFKAWQPDLLVLVELELWPNLLLAAKQHALPVAIVNARLSDQSIDGYLRLQRYLPESMAQVLDGITLVSAQSRPCAERFGQLGIPADRIVHTGSIKFDGAPTDRQNPLSRQLRQLANIQPHEKVLVAGSTQAPEESYVLSMFQSLASDHPDLRLILVPRHPERGDEVARLLNQTHRAWCRRTAISQEHPIRDQRILLVDTVGELGGMVGLCRRGLRRWQYGQPRRSEHVGAQRVWRCRLFWSQHAEFS